MQPHELADEVLRLWPKAFQPQETWRDEITSAVSDFSVSQRKGGLASLKMKRAGRSIDLEAVVESCRSAAALTSLPKSGAAAVYSKPITNAVEAWLAYLKDRGLREAARTIGTDCEVYTARLVDVLWTLEPATYRGTLDEMIGWRGAAGDVSPEARILHLYEIAKGRHDCQTHSRSGWKSPKAAE